MGWFGTLLGGSLGFFVAGPLGAVGGAALGHLLLDRRDGSVTSSARSGARAHRYTTYDRQAGYFVALFSILGKIAAADGSISASERTVVNKFIQDTNLSQQQRTFAIRIFEEGAHSTYTVEELATNFSQLTTGMETFRLNFIDLLVKIAAADGTIHPNEKRSIAVVARCLAIDNAQLERLFRSHRGSQHNSYQVLGCTPSSSNDEIRSAYRRMAAAYHPDTIIGKELPEEFVQLANRRFREIQSAYEAIKQERGIR